MVPPLSGQALLAEDVSSVADELAESGGADAHPARVSDRVAASEAIARNLRFLITVVRCFKNSCQSVRSCQNRPIKLCFLILLCLRQLGE